MYALYKIRNEYMVDMANRVIAVSPEYDVLNLDKKRHGRFGGYLETYL